MEMESKFQQRELQKAVTGQPNLTGIPIQMKLNFEQRSGMSFDDVRVHYNSDKPAQFHALAYTQGTQVYVGPGQERSLPHELGHVIQQKAGLVRANAMHPSGVAMNTDEALERQADEIGAGRRIEMSPANNASTDIVQRHIRVNNCIFAQAPGPDGKRKVMVKDGEPASIYFEESVSDSIKPLERLGIVKTEEGKVYKDSSGGVIGTFFRSGQRQIPDISSAYGQKNDEESTPKFSLPIIGTLIHRVLGLFSSNKGQPKRTGDEFQRAERLLKVQVTTTRELWSLANNLWRYSMRCLMNIISTDIIDIISLMNKISTDIINKTTKIVKAYHEHENPYDFIAMHLLGGDITLDIFALQSIAKQLSASPTIDLAFIEAEYNQFKEQNTYKPSDVKQKQDELLAGNAVVTSQDEVSFALQIAEEFLEKMKNCQNNGGVKAIVECIDYFKKQDKFETSTTSIIQSINRFCDAVKNQTDLILALEIVKEDLEFRMKQVEEELKPEVLAFVPLMPTGCDASATRRSNLSSLSFSSVKFEDKNFGKRTDEKPLIHWFHHFATPVPLPGIIGEDDCLFIEDAVGKSYDEDELANAHWVAHIYGQKEGQDSSPQTSEVETNNEKKDEFKKLDCRFNNLSEELRSKFLEAIKIDGDSVYTLTYFESGANVQLKIVVQKNMMMYKFLSIPPKPYIRHFIMDVAKTVLDEFVLQAFVLRDTDIQNELDSIQASRGQIAMDYIKLTQSPDYTIEIPYYTIERVHLQKEK